MDSFCKLVFIMICMLYLVSITEGSISVSNPNGGNTVVYQGTLTLRCIISPLYNYMFWTVPGLRSTPACYCTHTADSCNLAAPSLRDRYSCSSNISIGEFTLTLTNVNIGDGGNYRCEQEPDFGSININVQVPITSVDVTSPTASPVTVTENVTSTFVCETSPSRPQATIQWYKESNGGTNIQVIPGGVISTQDSGTSAFTRSTLKFTPNRNDHGYRVYCTAYNIESNSTFKSANQPQLIVQYAPDEPTVTGHAGDSTFYILAGRQQSLTCTVQGGRPPANLSWSCFNGTEQDRSSGVAVSKQVTWTAVLAHNGQRCTCQATHPLWSSPRQVYVVIESLYPPSTPTFTVQGQSVSGTVSVIEGRDVSVRCLSSGNPSPSYTWTPWGSSTSADTLTLTNVQASDQREYTCTAANRMVPSQGAEESGTSSAAVNLNVLFPPRSPSLTYNSISGPAIPVTLNIVRGDNFNIYCQAEAKPSASYQWTGQAGSNNRLTVAGIQTDRSWTCTVTNQMTPTVGATVPGSATAVITANVMYGPSTPSLRYHYSVSSSTPLTTSTLSVIQGKSFTVMGEGSESKPASSYSWGGDITSQTDTLTVEYIQVDRDGARSTCTASNTMTRTFGGEETGTNTTGLTIKILYSPTVNRFANDTAIENHEFTKTCSYTPGNPTTNVIEWTKSGSSTVITRDTTLTISNVSRASAGRYTCTAKNTMEPTGESAVTGTHSQTFQLVVYYSASIALFSINSQSEAGQFTYDENSTITMRCEVDSNPGSQITLTRVGDVLQMFENTRRVSYDITKITCLDAGMYSCTARNPYNENSIPKMTKQVFVRCPPRPFNTENNQTYYRALNDTVTLNIEFTAYPAPTSYRWYKRQSDNSWTEITVEKSSAAHHASLTIANIQEEDFRQYRVDIVNSVGSLKHMFFVAAQDKPQMPTNVTALNITHNSAVLQWTKGFNGSLEQTFYIEYLPSMKVEQILDSYEDTVLNITLKNLSPGTEYRVHIFAGNALGNSSKSTEYTFRTRIQELKVLDPPMGAICGGVGTVLAIVVVVVVIVFVILRRRGTTNKGGKKAPSPSRNISDSNLNSDHPYYNAAFHSGSEEPEEEDAATEGQQYEALQTTGQGSQVYEQLHHTLEDATYDNNRSTYEQLDPTLRRNDGVYDDINSTADTSTLAQADGRVYVN